jgi:hypothetical protein
MVKHKCCIQIQHLFDRVQMQTMESTTGGKNRGNKKKKMVNWLWAEQVRLTASKDRNFSFCDEVQTTSEANPPSYSLGLR